LGAGVTLGGGALLLGGTASFLLWRRPAAAGLHMLSATEAAVVRAMADVYFPPGGPFVVTVDDVDFVAGADEFVARLPAREGRLLRGLLVALEALPRLSGQGAFSSLPRAARAEVLSGFEESDVRARRQVASLLRLLVGMTAFDDPRATAAAGVTYGCPVVP
jgi:hypothetical protein